MKAYLTDGKTMVMNFAPVNCTGYRAERIEFDRNDISDMLDMMERDPSEFKKCMLQLQARIDRPTITPPTWPGRLSLP